MDRRNVRASDEQAGFAAADERPSLRDPRSSGSIKSSLARAVHQHRGFLQLARIVAVGEAGIWTGALPVVLPPAGASWGAAYRVVGGKLELAAAEGVPMALRAHLEGFDLSSAPSFAACRAVRSRRPVSEDRLFTGVVDARVTAQLDAAGISVGTAVPIVHGGTVLGVLLAGTSTREPIDGESLQFLDAAATFLAPPLALADSARGPASDERRAPSQPRVQTVSAGARKPIDAGRVTLDAVHQIGTSLRRLGADVRMSVDEGCHVLGDAEDLRLAVAHLVTNAAEAAAERAPVIGAPSQPRRVRVSLAREGAMVALGVEDSGRGVPLDLRARVFDAGFSTKAKGRGNGLAQVRQIALDHGGHVEIAASELGGALVRLVIPATAARPEQPSVGLPHSATVPQMRAAGRSQRAKAASRDDDDSDAEPTQVRRAAC
jgi:hypothetical protein